MKEVWKDFPSREIGLQHPQGLAGRSDDSWENPECKGLGHLNVEQGVSEVEAVMPIDCIIDL